VITCQECGKLNAGKDIGNYWICHDCNYDPSLEQEEKESEEG
jgi:hypothetical protein